MELLDEMEEEVRQLAAYCAVKRGKIKETYANKLVRSRAMWNMHWNLLMMEGQFEKYYRMSPSSYEKLVGMLAPTLSNRRIFRKDGQLRWETIPVEVLVGMTIRYLADGSMHDVRVIAGVSMASFYRGVHIALDSITTNTTLRCSMRLLMSLDEIRKAAAAYEKLSTNNFLKGCVVTFDGWGCCIKVPSKSETPHPRKFFLVITRDLVSMINLELMHSAGYFCFIKVHW